MLKKILISVGLVIGVLIALKFVKPYLPASVQNFLP